MTRYADRDKVVLYGHKALRRWGVQDNVERGSGIGYYRFARAHELTVCLHERGGKCACAAEPKQ